MTLLARLPLAGGAAHPEAGGVRLHKVLLPQQLAVVHQLHRVVLAIIVQYSTVQYIIVQLVLQYNTVQCSEVQYSTVQ